MRNEIDAKACRISIERQRFVRRFSFFHKCIKKCTAFSIWNVNRNKFLGHSEKKQRTETQIAKMLARKLYISMKSSFEPLEQVGSVVKLFHQK